MDWIIDKDAILHNVKKYRFVFLILLTGLFLMCLPASKEDDPVPAAESHQEEPQLQNDLADILSQVAGAGKVEVLLTQAAGEETVYQTDEDVSENDLRQDTVLITGDDRAETGLIRQVNPPVYLGAVVICQGADNANIRLSIVEAVMSVTGLTSDRITVLKMK